jgi:hypothetical protein
MLTNEMLTGGFLKWTELKGKAHKDKIVNVEILAGQFGPKLTLTLENGIGGCKKVSLNKTSLVKFVEKWGRNESKFKGRSVKLVHGKINGKDCILGEPA